MKNTKQVIALASAAALSVSVLAGCGGAASNATSESTSTATAEASNTAASDGTLVLAETGFEGKFSPFFAASSADQHVIDLTNIALLGADRKGEMILKGIEVRPASTTAPTTPTTAPLTALSPRMTTAPSPMISSCATT